MRFEFEAHFHIGFDIRWAGLIPMFYVLVKHVLL